MEEFMRTSVTPQTALNNLMGSRTKHLTREEVLDVIKELNLSQIEAIKAANERYKDED